MGVLIGFWTECNVRLFDISARSGNAGIHRRNAQSGYSGVPKMSKPKHLVPCD
jgi:hypothetical protein